MQILRFADVEYLQLMTQSLSLYNNMAPPQAIQKWLTLIGHCFATFSNAIGFGIYFTHTNIFADYYDVQETTINNSFYIGLIFQIIFCIPALKLTEWRLDYSLMTGAFLSMAGYWLQFAAEGNFYVVLICMLLESFGQALLLPMSAYLAERWFPLQNRSVAISLSFYSNLFGFAFGAILTTLYITGTKYVYKEMLIISILSTFCFVVSIILVRNKPKELLEKYKVISFKQIKQLWKYRYNTYAIIMSSVFLGVSWTFLSSLSQFKRFFSPLDLGILMTVWIVSGMAFGLIMSATISHWVTDSGTFICYDRVSKITLLIGIVGYIIMGICIDYKFQSFTAYIFLMIIIGVGSIGYYGLMLLSLIESFYPLSSLLIGNLICVGASLYSALSTAMGEFLEINVFYVMAAVAFLPFIYLCVTYKTNFKRYRYYLDQKKLKYTLLKVDDYKSLFVDKKFE